MKALLDTNILLDFFLQREPWDTDAVALWTANEQGTFEGYICATTLTNVFYIVRKPLGSAQQARNVVGAILAAMAVCPVDTAILHSAHRADFHDYEDAVQHASAVAGGLDAIITRDPNDYARATLPVLLPTDFLRQLPPPDVA
jgi:predicted nucleic acid-binding protein